MPANIIGGSGLSEELEPAFNNSPAKNITNTDIANWNGKQPAGDYATNTALSTLIPKSGGALTGQLSPTTTAQLRNIALVASEPVVGDMVEGTIYFVYEDV